MPKERDVFAGAVRMGASCVHDPASVPDAHLIGLAYAHGHDIGDVLRMCAAALEDWNVHDLAGMCRDRVGDVPDRLK